METKTENPNNKLYPNGLPGEPIKAEFAPGYTGWVHDLRDGTCLLANDPLLNNTLKWGDLLNNTLKWGDRVDLFYNPCDPCLRPRIGYRVYPHDTPIQGRNLATYVEPTEEEIKEKEEEELRAVERSFSILERESKLIQLLDSLTEAQELLDSLTEAQDLNRLAAKCYDISIEKGWGSDWSGGGVYLHLEASEFIESLRNKGEDPPIDEAADVLFVLFVMCKKHGINPSDILTKLKEKTDNMLNK